MEGYIDGLIDRAFASFNDGFSLGASLQTAVEGILDGLPLIEGSKLGV